jgi:tetratricopeptide (TPR) repeat protein
MPFVAVLALPFLGVAAACAAGPTTGSGVVISSRGEVLTAAHVVESCSTIRVQFSSKQEATAELVARDPKNDLAILLVKNPPEAVAAFREGAPIRAGDTVVALGYPLPSLLAAGANLTVGNVSALAGIENDSRYLQISAPVQPGNSGGPLLDASGRLIGIVMSKLNAASIASYTGDIPQNINFALKAEVARAFLDSRGIDYQTTRTRQQLSPADIGDAARPFTVYVECGKGALRSAAIPAPAKRPGPNDGNAGANQARGCEGEDAVSPDQQIASCSALIRSGRGSNRDLAIWFNNRGIAYKAKGDLDRAVADYDQAIRLDPTYAPALNSRGIAYKARGDVDKAIADYDRVIALNPQSAPAFNNRGYAYYTRKSYDRAVADYDVALKLDPANALTLNNRGYAFFTLKDYDRAIADYDRAIGLDPRPAMAGVGGRSHVNVYINRGVAYAYKGDFDRAIADYNEAIRLDPNDALAYSNRGHIYRRQGAYDRAVSDYGEALRLDPKDASLYVDRGFVRFLKGDYPGATADLQQAIERDQGAYPMLWRYLARARAGQDGRDELAATAARQTTRDWPRPVVEFYLGTRSADQLLAAAAKPEERCEAQYYLGEWHLLHRDRAKATDALRTAADTCPKDFYEYGGAVAELGTRNP